VCPWLIKPEDGSVANKNKLNTIKNLKASLLILWLSMITFASIVDYSTVKVSGQSVSIGSGFYLHVIAYFIVAFLFPLAA
jgi:hypothetical protein